MYIVCKILAAKDNAYFYYKYSVYFLISYQLYKYLYIL